MRYSHANVFNPMMYVTIYLNALFLGLHYTRYYGLFGIQPWTVIAWKSETTLPIATLGRPKYFKGNFQNFAKTQSWILALLFGNQTQFELSENHKRRFL